MASMKRNVNLEEIDTDSFMGISYLKYQTLIQKVIFIMGVLMSIVIDILGTTLLELDISVTMIVGLIPLFVSIAFGCNYNEDFSLIEYIVLLISSPVKEYHSKPCEDLEQLHHSAERIRQEEELIETQQKKASDEEQHKLLVRVVVVFVIFILAIIMIIVCMKTFKTDDIHHMVELSLNKFEV